MVKWLFVLSVVCLDMFAFAETAAAQNSPTPFSVQYFDPVTNYEWARLTDTLGLSYSTIATVCKPECSGAPLAGKDSSGWTWATRLDVRNLFVDASDLVLNQLFDDFESGPRDAAFAQQLRNKLGFTSSSPQDGLEGRGITADRFIARYRDCSNASCEESEVGFSFSFSPEASDPATGVWLFRPKATEPGTPSVVSVAPASGFGASQTFALVYSNPLGNAGLDWVFMLVNSFVSESQGCVTAYQPATNEVMLLNDDGDGWLPSGVLGTGTLQNSQCTVDLASSSSELSANTELTLSLALRFSSSFAGLKTVLMQATNESGFGSGWQPKGQWIVPQEGENSAPRVISVEPFLGRGPEAQFRARVADPDGWFDLRVVSLLLTDSETTAHSCMVAYLPTLGQLLLRNDAGTDWLGPVMVGAQTQLENSQCTLDPRFSNAFSGDRDVFLNVQLYFKPGFSGRKTTVLYGEDHGGANSDWLPVGTWNP